MEQEEDYYDNQEQYFVDCCRAGEVDEVETLLKDETLKVDWVNQQNNNCLHMAAANGHIPILLALFSRLNREQQLKKRLLNGKNSDGNTPLHYATICGKKQIVELLLKEGADPNIHNECERTAFRQAQLLNNYEIGEILAKVTESDPKDLAAEDLVECEAGNERIDEEDEHDGEEQQTNEKEGEQVQSTEKKSEYKESQSK